MQLRASIILPTYRRFRPVLSTVRQLLGQSCDSFEIIVVDQNAQWPEDLQREVSELRAHPQVVWVEQSEPNVVIARNSAVARSNGEILVFVDDDVEIPDRDFVAKHIRVFDDASIHIVAGRECARGESPLVVPADRILPERFAGKSPLQQALWFDRNSDRPADVCTFSTCNGSIRRTAFLAVGGFDENFGGNSYGDDFDLVLRLNQKGFRSIYEPSIWLIHLREPMGGLRMSDRKNRIDWSATATGLWLFALRHGAAGMYSHLVFRHVLRKTVLLRANVTRPWVEPRVIAGLISGYLRARRLLGRGVRSRLQT